MRKHQRIFPQLHNPFVRMGSTVRRAVVAGLAVAAIIAGPTAALAGETAAKPCVVSSGIPCPAAETDDASAALDRSSRGTAIQGKTLPDQAPSTAEADAAEAEANVGAAGSALESRAIKSSFTFYGRNSSGKEMGLKFFSKTRKWVWPSATTHWVLPPDRKQYVMKLICQKGEKVCFGGFWKSNPNVYWGVGLQGNKGCSACCYTCNGGHAAVNFVR